MQKKLQLILLVVAVAAVITAVAIRRTQEKATPQVSQITLPKEESVQCVAASLEGRRLVGGLGVPVPLFPGAKRVAYGDVGISQYVVKAKDQEVLGYYADRMKALCWSVQKQSHNQVVYQRENRAVKLSVMPNEVSGKVLLTFELLNKSQVLGETVWIAQATTCPADQVYCTSSTGGSGWCQMPPCPPPPDTTTTPPPPTTTGPESCTGGTTWCTSTSGGGWCQYPPCPSSSGTTSTPTPSTTCSGSYQQPGATYPMCNYSTCPSGCNYGADGCPNSCYTPPQSTTCSGQYQQAGSTYPNCNYSVCPNGCTWDSTGCPSGCYSSSGSSPGSCPQGQYWCNGACISSGSYCSPSGGSTYMGDQSSCTSSGGLWCQPTTSPHCHAGPNPSSCEPDNASGMYCPSDKYLCNGTCVPMGTSCSSTSWPNDPASCSAAGKAWCTSSAGGSGWCQYPPCPTQYPSPSQTTSCPSGQWMCNNACIPTSATCNGYSYYWQGSTTSCGSGMYFCPSTNSCIANGTPCSPTTGGTTCPSGQYWCSYTSSCVSTSISCVPIPPNLTPRPTNTPSPQPTQSCGQCQILQNGVCTRAPAGTSDPRCTGGGVCDQYGGCVTLRPNTRMVGDGAVCGDRFCEPGKNENRENCPEECSNPPSPSPQPSSTLPEYPGLIVEPGPGQIGTTEEQIRRLDEDQLRRMKEEVAQFAKNVKQMEREVKRMERKLKSLGVGVPQELVSALAKAPEVIKKIEAATTVEGAQDLMEDLRDIVDAFQEWGPNFGRLVEFGEMLKRAERNDLPRIRRDYNRVKRYESKSELKELFPSLHEIYGTMTKALQDAKALAKTDPESGFEKIDVFYGGMEEFWAQVALIDMMRNVGQALSQANSEIRRAESKIKSLERRKTVNAETILDLKETLNRIKGMLPQLKELTTKKPLDYEAIQDTAETFWQEIKDFQDRLAELGQGYYMPQVKRGESIIIEIPESFRF